MTPGLPNLVIAGVTKAGTSSLYRYLGQHPDIALGDVKEIDHYAPMLYGEQPPPLAQYAAHFRDGERPFRLEASPRYFAGGPALTSRLAADLGRPKVMITLRDPVGRMWSSYAYKRSKSRLPDGMRFEQFVERCIEVAEQGLELDPEQATYRTAVTGRYADHLGCWFDQFGDDLRVVFFEDLVAAPADTVAMVCRWAGIDAEPVAGFDFGARNATVQPRSQYLRRAALRWNDRLTAIADDNSRLKRTLRSAYGRINSGGLDETMGDDARERVRRYYSPTLEPLRAMLTARDYALPEWVTA